jgi:hypothetical protein
VERFDRSGSGLVSGATTTAADSAQGLRLSSAGGQVTLPGVTLAPFDPADPAPRLGYSDTASVTR